MKYACRRSYAAYVSSQINKNSHIFLSCLSFSTPNFARSVQKQPLFLLLLFWRPASPLPRAHVAGTQDTRGKKDAPAFCNAKAKQTKKKEKRTRSSRFYEEWRNARQKVARLPNLPRSWSGMPAKPNCLKSGPSHPTIGLCIHGPHKSARVCCNPDPAWTASEFALTARITLAAAAANVASTFHWTLANSQSHVQPHGSPWKWVPLVCARVWTKWAALHLVWLLRNVERIRPINLLGSEVKPRDEAQSEPNRSNYFCSWLGGL